MNAPNESPNPRRVEAGRRNRMKWRGFTAEGLERLRLAALRNQPWKRSTGPRTAEGKRRSSENGRGRQKGPVSVRQIEAELAKVCDLMTRMRSTRQRAV
jgi:hypothetical protein